MLRGMPRRVSSWLFWSAVAERVFERRHRFPRSGAMTGRMWHSILSTCAVVVPSALPLRAFGSAARNLGSSGLHPAKAVSPSETRLPPHSTSSPGPGRSSLSTSVSRIRFPSVTSFFVGAFVKTRSGEIFCSSLVHAPPPRCHQRAYVQELQQSTIINPPLS